MTKFFIDPGHRWPNKDRGAVGFLNEEQVVLPIAFALRQILEQRGHQVKILAIGEAVDSVQESLSARVQQSNEYAPDLYISIHANASNATDRPMGTEAFTLNRGVIPIAQKFIDNMVALGFKRREVKTDAGHLHVLTHTQDPAALFELFFVDSSPDCELFKKLGSTKVATAIADAVAPITEKMASATTNVADHNPSSQDLTASVTSVKLGPIAIANTRTVGDVIKECDTGLIRPLSLQIISKMNRLVPVDKSLLTVLKHDLIYVSSAACNPYLQMDAVSALIRAVARRGVTMKINSCFRTTPQQWLIKQWLKAGIGGVTAAAPPGKSNHEGGSSIDIEDPDGWRDYLEDEGWRKLGTWDNMHFDYFGGRSDIAQLQITAFQMLWNLNNIDQQLAIDGSYGDKTSDAIRRSPIAGFAKIQ